MNWPSSTRLATRRTQIDRHHSSEWYSIHKCVCALTSPSGYNSHIPNHGSERKKVLHTSPCASTSIAFTRVISLSTLKRHRCRDTIGTIRLKLRTCVYLAHRQPPPPRQYTRKRQRSAFLLTRTSALYRKQKASRAVVAYRPPEKRQAFAPVHTHIDIALVPHISYLSNSAKITICLPRSHSQYDAFSLSPPPLLSLSSLAAFVPV